MNPKNAGALMTTKLIGLGLPIAVALVSLGLVTSALAQGPNASRADAPAGAMGASTPALTATVQLVNSDGALLAAPPLYPRLISDTEPLTLYLGQTAAVPLSLSVEVASFSLEADGGRPVAARFSISPTSLTLTDTAVPVQIKLIDGAWTPGSYTGQLGLNVSPPAPAALSVTPPATTAVTTATPLSGTQAVSGATPSAAPQATNTPPVASSEILSFTVLVNNWGAQLAWAQADFSYRLEFARSDEQPIRIEVTDRMLTATDVTLALDSLSGRDGPTSAFPTAGLVTATTAPTLTPGTIQPLTLTVNAGPLPGPGTYSGTLRLSASNAAPITATISLVALDRPRGSYQLLVGELGATHGLTGTQPITTALQFSGVRSLPFVPDPGSGSLTWPYKLAIAMLAVLLSLGVGLIVAYAAWMIWAPSQGSLKVGVYGLLGVVSLVLSIGLYSYALAQRLEPVVVDGRQVFVWEAHGRGPVRELKAVGGVVANERGDAGVVELAGTNPEMTGTAKIADVLDTNPVSSLTVTKVTGLSQPGVYQGRIQIESPNIADGHLDVPVQVTVHDLLAWPVLVILLGVVVGGWTKYLAGTAGDRLNQKRALESAWSKWNAGLAGDTGCGPEGHLNPIYGRVLDRLNAAKRLLDQDAEWGIPAAKETVTAVESDLSKFVDLKAGLARLREEMASVELATVEQSLKAAHTRLQTSRDKLVDLERQSNPTGAQKNNLKVLRAAADDRLAAASLGGDLRTSIDALAGDLCAANLQQAAQDWSEYVTNRLTAELSVGQDHVKQAAAKDQALAEALKPATDELDEAVAYLKPNPPTSGALAVAWRHVIQARAMLDLLQMDQLASQLEAAMIPAAPADKHSRLGALAYSGIADALWAPARTLPSVSRALVAATPFQLIVEDRPPYLWDDIAQDTVTCVIKVRLEDLPAGVGLAALTCPVDTNSVSPVAAELKEDKGQVVLAVKMSNIDKWSGDPVPCKIWPQYPDPTAGAGGSMQISTPVEVTIESPYELVLPLQRLVVGETTVVEARWRGRDPKPLMHDSYAWYLNEVQVPAGSGKGLTCQVTVPQNDRNVHIGLQVFPPAPKAPAAPAPATKTPVAPAALPAIQKASLRQLAQESPAEGLARDKRRLNLNRQISAALLAVVGGIVANRVFGVTFGSLEEYLVAFVWGVGVNYSVDPTVNTLAGLPGGFQDLVKSLFGKSKTNG